MTDAAATDARTEAMPLLPGVVDVEALDCLHNQSRAVFTAFRYCCGLLRIEADGRITIDEGHGDERRPLSTGEYRPSPPGRIVRGTRVDGNRPLITASTTEGGTPQ